MPALFSEGFLLGLSTGVYCLASCLPVLAPYLLAGGSGFWKANLFIFLEFLAGRFLAYMLFALAAVSFGKLSGPYLPPRVLAAGMAVTALLMFYSLFSGHLKQHSSCLASFPAAWAEKRIPCLLGFLTGINICPPFAAGLLRLVGLADILKGLAYFGGFFVSTSLFLLPALAPTSFLSSRLKNIGRMTLFLAASWYLLLGLRGIVG
ncbi:MAG: sulfite exporter TauE/SafE family protein [Elusimicrobia bacterium]|nr:sulfite exporter TauE/SafE family protein [Elusimicrobiota bacterium]